MLTDNQKDIMRHSLGLNGAGQEYRNHFVTGAGSTDFSDCESLVAQGYMTKQEGYALSGGNFIYRVSPDGRAALKH